MPQIIDRDTLSAIAPKLAQISNEVLFDDIWRRAELAPRERSLITLAALIALGRTQQLPWHLALAQNNGLTRQEIIEAITHLAFYAGWPAAVSALGCLPEEEQ
ncbi:carboxymuconolactone decarboxylase family protein [Affinibrenneria salicis]|uniref:Carboxymuconolactone decarboxylase family protein n=1 Tax=Affinibrenneria salicis TaxID=2590031 RepID=A0A5J5FUH4_9GAMM|nr:carboxymuconolactone decarboxylase family protein [Affinibrenneria salicis]KAA8996926.1 carboxymuconolactone decarboxylase family protein [Affinibrenneria salicis]